MSHDVYINSYPKATVKPKIAQAWETGRMVGGFDYLDRTPTTQLWALKVMCCYEALHRLSDDEEVTCALYNRSAHIAINRIQGHQFCIDIAALDFPKGDLPEHVALAITQLQDILDGFDFDNNYLVVSSN